MTLLPAPPPHHQPDRPDQKRTQRRGPQVASAPRSGSCEADQWVLSAQETSPRPSPLRRYPRSAIGVGAVCEWSTFMTWDPLIDKIDVVDLRKYVGPGDDGLFVAAYAAGRAGWYGPVSEASGRYVQALLSHAAAGASATEHRALNDVLRNAAGQRCDQAVSWAIGAVDCAVWDLHGRLTDQPVASLIASEPAPEVRAYASWLRLDICDSRNADAVARTAYDCWAFTKWGLRRGVLADPADEAARLVCAARRVAEVAGERIALDALGTWDRALTLAFADQTDPSTVLWLEDPLPGTSLDGYREISTSGVPLAIGERLLIDDDGASLIDAVQPVAFTIDVVGCGGLTRAVDLVATASAADVPVFPHGRSIVPAVHLAAAFPDTVAAVEYRLQREPSRQRLYTEPWSPMHGTIRLPSAPGLGVTPRNR